MKILIIEDEPSLRELIQRSLEKERYVVEAAADFQSGLRKIEDYDYDCVLLDIMLPDGNGLNLLEQLKKMRKRENVIIISAKDSLDDKVLGLELGADDYLPKPFDPDELLARVRAMLRRGGGYTPNVIAFGDLALDCGEGILRCGNRSERLSGREFQVMELFMRAPRAIVSAERIMERIWGWESDAEINVVWVHISNLRKKLAVVGSSVVIRVSRGLGYSLEEGK